MAYVIDIFYVIFVMFSEFFREKRVRIAIVITIIIAVGYLIVQVFIGHDTLTESLSAISGQFLTFSENIADLFLRLTGTGVQLKDHVTSQNISVTDSFIPELRYKKFVALILLFIWLMKAPVRDKILYSIITIVTQIVVLSLYIAFGAYLSSFDYYDPVPLAIPHTFALLCFITIIFLWYRKYKESLLKWLSKIKIDSVSLDKKSTSIFIIIYIYIIIVQFFLEFFDYEPWVNLLFTSSQKVLYLFGHNATVEPFHLVGDNGSIYMAKYCLGFKTMLLFASVVYLTGERNYRRWIYIIVGTFFLNVLNILRFVLLFIHIQKNGDYSLSMDQHDLYNYFIYSIVFIMWIIWFEKFSDLRLDFKKKANK